MYDVKRYADALSVFRRMETAGDPGVALVWQGHMLDLLRQREEAVAAYKRALEADLDQRHDQYRIVLSRDYVEQRTKTTFSPVPNQLAD